MRTSIYATAFRCLRPLKLFTLRRWTGFAMICVLLAATGSLAAKKAGSPIHSGAARSCLLDSDADGLADCVETNTGVFVHARNTGTNPNIADTDEDGLSDGDEVEGTTDGLDLPALGVNPLHKDILLEYDWMNDAECGIAHTHRPSKQTLRLVEATFEHAPVVNPDGRNGIRLHQDASLGDVAVDNGGNLVQEASAFANGFIQGGIGGTDYVRVENTNFSLHRRGYFHYVVFAHGYTAAPGSSGQATVSGYRMMITLGCDYDDDDAIAKTIVHELGHNLGLLHGGDEHCNRKPNYNSVMNYRYQFTGTVDCNLHSLGFTDFSRGTRRTLIESALDENLGVCVSTEGDVPIDWNLNHEIDPDLVSADVNFYPHSACPGLTELHDYDDWSHIGLTAVRVPTTSVSEPCSDVPGKAQRPSDS